MMAAIKITCGQRSECSEVVHGGRDSGCSFLVSLLSALHSCNELAGMQACTHWNEEHQEHATIPVTVRQHRTAGEAERGVGWLSASQLACAHNLAFWHKYLTNARERL